MTTPSAKKITSYDKFQALKRNPNYQADYREFERWCRERGITAKDYLDNPEAAQRAEALCRKYGIWYLFHPAVKLRRGFGGDYFTIEDEVVTVVYPNKYRDLSEEEINAGKNPRFLPVPVFDEGDFLIIKINLKRNKDEIKEEVNNKIDYYHYFINHDNRRLSKDKVINKWHVFDIYNETKNFRKTFSQLITKARSEVRFLKILGGDAEIPKIDLSTVRKAYHRAFELVYSIAYDPNIHSPKKLPPKLIKTCDMCPERETCDTLCPDVMDYVIQDEKYLREKLTKKEIFDIMEPDVYKKTK